MKTPRVFESVETWRAHRRTLGGQGDLKTGGFVPTMGALHDGHVSLVRRSVAENDWTLVSIFVNPTQFNDPKDLAKYPRTLEADLAKLAEAGADYVLVPQAQEIYADDYHYKVSESTLSRTLCGAYRPGHFDGVLTVVLKLLQIAAAERAYFGKKDLQQLLLIEGMAKAFFLPTHIVGCEIVREKDGLAMSSRNIRLSPAERERAPIFAKILRESPTALEARVRLENEGYSVDYVEDHFGRRLGAIHVGEVRLIDNVEI